MSNSTVESVISTPLVILIGPTAIGKTALSIKIAKEFGFEIVSVDSMQVYRYMDIGTAKITEEEMEGVPHHLIDVVNPDEAFDAGIFEKLALAAIKKIEARGKKILVTGGTGLYLNALVNGLSAELPSFPEIRAELSHELKTLGAHALHDELNSIDCISAKRIHENDSYRVLRGLEIYRGTGITWSSLIQEHKENRKVRFKNILNIGLTRDRSSLYERIGRRSVQMIDNGLEEEVRWLLKHGYPATLKSMRSIGYSHMTKFIAGEYSKDRMLELLTRDTRRYAKRQYTWFNKIENINWLQTGDSSQAMQLIESFIS